MVDRSESRAVSVTDPAKYNHRDILLFLQLLHSNGLIEPDNIVDKSNSDIVNDIATQWFKHKSTKLSTLKGLDIDAPWTQSQLQTLYQNLLDQNDDCSNTTELANKIYAERVKQLRNQLESSQETFTQLLKEQ
ncbi:hypothetical protein PSN45_004962 [Yamadazyma tenuis]|uniref:Uncharacterized protein n=1 Tax=Candida tenuis (strain ATCC 10573 / BCRC 21748 / CBS 615 / JCM 9827 / NBRC 10315 / NRRL Y-1498 / VKM Y-70) TaxID=590646 RepID=G3B2A5_CANTC|nr:uncharacterized protein CANTEDRAFT_113409 [Yamadazyma tenuis ATCC 10573]EGV64629.1 hypothetical protein CANTEDRAFT_113409 [Yamadazyma tenuis ATCC 10573]WEJ97411.1 hypothetical protein PSN45_004962 [Yamadazyma tenuis]